MQQVGDIAWKLNGNILNEQPVYWLGESAWKIVAENFECTAQNSITVSRVGTR